jgi:hypothetical protein
MSRHHRHRPRERAHRNGTPVGAAPVGPRAEAIPELVELSPFSVFCALWLGITATDGYALAGLDAVAARFGIAREALDAYLCEHELRAEDLRRARFDLESARLDIRVAPAGISRLELARTLWQELRALGRAPHAPA